MKHYALMLVLLAGCPSGGNRGETLSGVAVSGGGGDPTLEYSAAVALTFEQLARQACACTDDSCKMLNVAAFTEWQDERQQQEMTMDVVDLDSCWAQRAQRAIDLMGGCLEGTARFTPGAACGNVTPAVATSDAWWKRSKPCPGDAELEFRKVPGVKAPLRARCVDDGVDRARYTSWHPNGSVFVDAMYDAEGALHGPYTVYYPHGRPAKKVTYVHGGEQGIVEAWYPDGKPRSRHRAVDGKTDGAAIAWDRAGVATTTYFDRGFEVDAAEWAASGGEQASCSRQCVDDKLPSVEAPALDYSVSAERNFEKGTAAAAAGRWREAALYFDFVRNRFPDSQFKQRADQELAKHAAEYRRPYDACTAHCGGCASTCNTDATACTAHCATVFPIP